METWKKIEGYDKYEVSDWGRVRRGERVLKGVPDKGYLRVYLYGDTTGYVSIHRLVGKAFIPNLNDKPTINHIDHNRSNNRLENLEWATHTEQRIHSPVPIGKSGHRNIYLMKDGTYNLQFSRNNTRFSKRFPTLPEAIKARDEFVKNV